MHLQLWCLISRPTVLMPNQILWNMHGTEFGFQKFCFRGPTLRWKVCSLTKRNDSLTNIHSFARFGPGIYSKRYGKAADRHATSCTTSPYRIMVICKVIVMGTDGEISSDRNTGCAVRTVHRHSLQKVLIESCFKANRRWHDYGRESEGHNRKICYLLHNIVKT